MHTFIRSNYTPEERQGRIWLLSQQTAQVEMNTIEID